MEPSLGCTCQPIMAITKAGPVSDLCKDNGSNLGDTEEWKQVTTWSYKSSCPIRAPVRRLASIKEQIGGSGHGKRGM